MSDLFMNPSHSVLTDCELINPHTHSAVKVHKAILASGSQWFLRVFCRTKKELQHKVEVPRPIAEIGAPIDAGTDGQHCATPVSDEIVNRIVKYIYHNQDFNVIKAEINGGNVSQIYS
jgi:hypothetical protein